MIAIWPENMIEAFDAAEQKFAAKEFAVAEQSIGYSELCKNVRRLAAIFQQRGVKQGDSVVFSTQDDMLASTIFIALLRCGITAIFLDSETRSLRANHLINLVKPELVILDESIAESWQIAGKDKIIPIRKTKKSILNLLLRRKTQDGSLGGLMENASMAELPAHIDASLVAYVLFTSGTTSDPQGVCITHRALFSHLKTLSRVYGLTPESKILNTLMLSHADGIIQGPVLAFYNAACWFRPFRFRVKHIEDILDTIYRERITHFIAVPTILSLLCQLGNCANNSFDNGAFAMTVSCGAQLEVALWAEFEKKFNNRIVNVYGLTETVAGGIFAGPDDVSHQMGTIGKPVDCEVRIVDENGRDKAPGEQGELLVKSDSLTIGYFKAPEATRGILKDGWLYTGDIAAQTEEGCYKILGRRKAIVISGGINIHPGEVNEVLLTHPSVAESETLGEPDPVWGEHVVSAVSLKAAGSVSEVDLISYCRTHLEEKKVPLAIYILDSLPRGRSGKVQIEALKAAICELKRPEQMKLSSAEATILEVAATCLKKDVKSLSLDSSEEDLPEWDSLAHLILVAEVERIFSIKLSPAEVIRIKSLRDLLTLCTRKAEDMP
ncbi:MAG: AMP-binding protein [Candidatus Riflebacteria bacterium]|nr:AMP-binding protein [Candidatus Riflebacteria bacterium]